MKVLIFSELFYPHGSGAELATWLYSKLLAQEGFQVTVITKQFPGEASVESVDWGIRIYRLPLKMKFGNRYDTLVNFGVLNSTFLNRLLSESDVVYIPGNWYSAIPFAKIHKKPVVVHLHNYLLACPTSLMYNFVERKVGVYSLKSFMVHEKVERKRGPVSIALSSFLNESLGRYYRTLGYLADSFIFVSNAQRDLVLSKAPCIKEKSSMIYNPIPSIPPVLAESTGVGYFGGNRFIKGIEVFLNALKSLSHVNRIDAYLTMTMEQHKCVRRIGTGININFLPKLNSEDFSYLMRRLSIVAFPSLWPEPLPYTVVESMLYGKLVIASRIGGIPEILDGAGLGVKMTKPNDSKELADALGSFLSLDLEKATEFGTRNREFILKKFDNKKTLEAFIQVIDKVC